MAKGGVTFKIEGLRDLEKAIAALGQSAGKNVLRRAGRKALEPFDKAWRSKAPVDENSRDFVHLKDSGGIGSKLSRSQRRAHKRESTVEIFAGPGPHSKAVQQEFGNEHNPPQPFMRPAWEEAHGEVLEGVRTELAADLDKVTQRLARKAARLAAKNKAR